MVGEIKGIRRRFETSATIWLDGISRDSLVNLQSTLPNGVAKKKTRRKQNRKPSHLIDALWYGVAALEIEDASDLHALASVIQCVPNSSIEVDDPLTPTQIANWISSQMPIRSDEPGVALACAGWLYGLSYLGNEVEPSVWLETLQTVLCQVDRAWDDNEPQSKHASLLWSCEIPLAFALQMSTVGPKDKIVRSAYDLLSDNILAAAKAPETWLIDGGRQIRALLGVVTRSHATSTQLGLRKWKAATRKSLAKLAKIAVGFTDPNGLPFGMDQQDAEGDASLWAELEKICNNSKLTSLIKSKGLNSKPKRSKSKIPNTDVPPLQFYFPQVECGVFRRDWNEAGNVVSVDYSTDPMRIDAVDQTGNRLLSGYWQVILQRDGRQIEFDSTWEEICWFTDDDVDYLELETHIESEHCRIQRQIGFFRDEGLLLLSDSLLAEEEDIWTLESKIPVANGVTCPSKFETTELLLCSEPKSDKAPTNRSLVLPLALPEWRRGCKLGGLSFDDSDNDQSLIRLQQTTGNKRLYAPIIVTLRKQHLRKPFTWRNLTVAENREIQPDHVAKSFRVQFGKDQYFLYRSLADVRPRSALGQHLCADFYAGRFDSEDGEVETLLEVSG